MDLQAAQKSSQLFAQRSAAVGSLLAMSLAANLILSVCVVNGNHVILVPTLPAETSIDANGRVDADYLEDMTRDAAWLFLNKTPETAGYLERRAQRLMDPVHFEAVKTALEKDSAKAEQDHTSQTFFPDAFFEDPAALYSEVRGRLLIVQGDQVLDDQQKIYAFHWTKTGTLLRLAGVAEITAADARGTKVTPLSAGAL